MGRWITELTELKSYQNLHILEPMVHLGVSVDWQIFHNLKKNNRVDTGGYGARSEVDHARSVMP
jgi:hypothetical protein